MKTLDAMKSLDAMKYIKSDIINIIITLELMEHIRCNEILNSLK